MRGDTVRQFLQACPSHVPSDQVVEATAKRAERGRVVTVDEHASPKSLDSKAQRSMKIWQQSRAALPVEPQLVVRSAFLKDVDVDPERERDATVQKRERGW